MEDGGGKQRRDGKLLRTPPPAGWPLPAGPNKAEKSLFECRLMSWYIHRTCHSDFWIKRGCLFVNVQWYRAFCYLRVRWKVLRGAGNIRWKPNSDTKIKPYCDHVAGAMLPPSYLHWLAAQPGAEPGSVCFPGPWPEAIKCDQIFNSKYRVTSLIYSICFVQKHSHVLNISLDFVQEMVDELTLFFFRSFQSCFGRIFSFFFLFF